MSRLTDNEVSEIAKMQKRIDDLEQCFKNIYINLREEGKMIPMFMPDEYVWGLDEVYRLIEFIKERHPEILKEIGRAERRKRQRQKRRQHQQTTKKREPFLKRLFNIVNI